MTDNGALVLLVEDEPQMRRFIRAALESHGYRVVEAASATEAIRLTTSHNPDVILLDLGLPDLDGVEVAKQIRGWSAVPIIVLSARGREDDKVATLDAGADDYLTKPFGINELLARLRVAVRHGQMRDRAPSMMYDFGDLHLDVAKRAVRRGDTELHLTPTEYKLLLLFARHAGRVVTHKQILHDVWGQGHTNQTHHVRVHVAELRKKIEHDAARPVLLLTEPGVGYRLREST